MEAFVALRVRTRVELDGTRKFFEFVRTFGTEVSASFTQTFQQQILVLVLRLELLEPCVLLVKWSPPQHQVLNVLQYLLIIWQEWLTTALSFQNLLQFECLIRCKMTHSRMLQVKWCSPNYLVFQFNESFLSLGSYRGAILLSLEQVSRQILLQRRQVGHSMMPLIDWVSILQLLLQKSQIALFIRIQVTIVSHSHHILKALHLKGRQIDGPWVLFIKRSAFNYQVAQIVNICLF